MPATIKAVSYYLPSAVLSNEAIEAQFPEWKAEDIFLKTGIRQRHVCAHDEIASDCAVNAAEQLFSENDLEKDAIDFLIFVTQSPDYASPTTACVIQDRLGLNKGIGAIDINLGCTGFVYGLSVANGLIQSGAAKEVLLLTSETLTKYIHPNDKSCKTIFGDAGAAALISGDSKGIGNFQFGTDGSGKDKMIKPNGAMRNSFLKVQGIDYLDEFGNQTNDNCFHMNGPEVFIFTMKHVPKLIADTLEKNSLSLEEVDLFIFHQANGWMLENLRKKIGIPKEKFFMYMENIGNTVSSTLPICWNEASKTGKIKPGQKVLLAAFGVGLSMAATVVET